MICILLFGMSRKDQVLKVKLLFMVSKLISIDFVIFFTDDIQFVLHNKNKRIHLVFFFGFRIT